MALPLLLALSLVPLVRASLGADQLAVTCTFTQGCSIAVDGAPWSESKITKTRANGKWCSSEDGTLEPKKTAALSGSDAMGEFSGTSLLWSCGGVPYETAVRVYHTPDGDAAVFSQRWPEGAATTALGAPKVPGPGGVQEQVASAFPSITPTHQADQNYMVVYNQVSSCRMTLIPPPGARARSRSDSVRAFARCCPINAGPLARFRTQRRWWVGWRTARSTVPGVQPRPPTAASPPARWLAPWSSTLMRQVSRDPQGWSSPRSPTPWR